MSRYRIWLRLGGHISELEHVATALSELPYQLLRTGDQHGNRIQPVDLLSLDLASWERGGLQRPEEEEEILAEERRQLAAATSVLWQIVPILNQVDRTQIHAELYMSTIRAEDQGGVELPSDFVAAAAARLPIEISILVLLEDAE